MTFGHSRIIKTLRSLADEKRIAHGYLFFGPEGVGKKRIAESFAHHVEGGSFSPSEHILSDMLMTVPDAEEKIGIDAVRRLKGFLYSKPNISVYRCAIIDDAHRMTPEAQNALLKIAEEPPQSGVVILITSDRDALMTTLRSRIQQIYFAPFPQEKIETWLSDVHGYTAEKAKKSAQVSCGAPGRALHATPDEEDYDATQFLFSSLKRKDIVKRIIAPVDFNLADFLDRCIAILARDMREGKTIDKGLWHRMLSLRQRAAYGTLNARIQLMALMT
ncbi:MAG: AAA family ATPase [Patescibacteria group bacterium]|nr:AAA family ATPase [Patescibacteria group bacterium]